MILHSNLLYLIYLVICSYPTVYKCDLVYSTDDSATTSIKQQSTQYTVKVGETLVIPCLIENRKQATVIWQFSKSRIPETLTVGYFYYRKDFRIRVIANTTSEKEQSWNLEIRKVRIEDEGYYSCKVMAEPESLKRVVHLKVEVDLKISPVNPDVDLDDALVVTCNTSFSIGDAARVKLHNSSPRLHWYKDGELFAMNDHHHNNNSNVNYKIDMYAKPVLWSRIIFKSIKNHNLGTYTCKFRSQNVTTIVSSQSGRFFLMLFITV